MLQKRKHIHFTYQDVADLKGVSIHAVYKAVQDKRLDVRSLLSIINYVTGDGRRKDNKEYYVEE